MKTLALFSTSLVLALFGLAAPARAAAPSATTGTPSNITTNSATLNGSANPNGLATTAWFEWGTTTNYGTLTAAQSLGAGAAPVPVTANISPLLTDTNYHARLVASNSSGLSYGADVIVTPTLLLYLYAGESWTYEFHDLPANGQTINNGQAFCLGNFTVWPGSFNAGSSVRWELFETATNSGQFYNAVVNAPASGGSGGGFFSWADRQGAVRLTVLTGSVAVASVYFQRVDEHFPGFSFAQVYANTITPTRNPQPPSFATQFVSSVTVSSAVVSFDINVKNLPTLLSAQFGASTNYGSATGTLPDNFDYFVRRNLTLTNLAPDTVYQTRVAATNSAGLAYGQNLTFKTLAPAVIATLPASQRTVSSATLNAQATVKGIAASAWFQWGVTTNYNQTTAPQNLGSASVTTNVAVPITGLSAQTAYYCRAVIASAGVTNFGADVLFTTPPPPANVVVTNLATDDVRGAIERGGSVVFACDGTLVLSNQIEIANDVTLDAGGRSITLSGNNQTRIFSITPGTTLRLTNLVFVNGRATNTGGALLNQGTVFADRCRFLSNAVIGAAGLAGTNGSTGVNAVCPLMTAGQPGGAGGAGQAALGGAIFNAGTFSLLRCYFASNSAAGGEGGEGGIGGNGGQCPPPPSQASQRAPGAVGGDGGAGGTAAGAAIASLGHLIVDSCTFSNSMSLGGNGITGGRGGYGRTVTYVQENSGKGGMGGLALGGAVFSPGTMLLSNNLFVSNYVRGASGGGNMFLQSSYSEGGLQGSGLGGAVFGGSNSIAVNCTFLGNEARGGDSIIWGGFNDNLQPINGGDAIGGAIASTGSLQAINLTLAGNTTVGGLPSIRTRIVGTYSGTNGGSYGGSLANTGGVFQIVNTILSGGVSNNCYGPITDLGHNLSSDATPAWTSGTSLNNTDPLLLPLGDYGGPTLTMALHAGSPALNNADCALAPATDQRGFPRPGGPGCDIGATEGASAPALQVFRNTPAPHLLRWTALAGRTYRIEPRPL